MRLFDIWPFQISKWRTSLPIHMYFSYKDSTLSFTWSLEKTLFWLEAQCIGHHREYPAGIGESLLTSSFTCFLAYGDRIRLNSEKPWPYIWTKWNNWKSWLSWAICAVLSSLHEILKEVSAIKNCEISVWRKS